MSRVYIDGSAGTVGLALQLHLPKLVQDGLVSDVITLSSEERRNDKVRQAAMASADVVVLCLPDEAARPAVRMAHQANPKVRILDASAAHRCAPDWVYGLPEITPTADIRNARYVANPGCFATACVLAARPLSPLLFPPASRELDVMLSYPAMAFQGFTGKSAGGRKMLDDDRVGSLPKLAQFGLKHRHLPEIELHGRVTPMLTTMVGDWYKGMLVQSQVALPADQVLDAYAAAYDDRAVIVRTAASMGHSVNPQLCNDTNLVQIVVAEQANGYSAIAVVLDNLGKGSAGAAADNLRLMLS